ncbi:MAG: flavin monoamine oxidase family protein, partial [Solirubrobacteraceae bacterium]
MAIIGAGLAGMHAAWRLHGAGLQVVVLEARERVGGRTWSHALADGTVVERGGEFVAPDDDVLRGLCGELGLPLIPHGFSFDRRPTLDAPAPSQDDVAELEAAARTRVQERADDFPASAAIAPRTPAQVSAARRLETSLSVPLSAASARRTFTGGGHGYDPAVRVHGGNQSVTLALASRLQAHVRLRTPVVAIEHDERGATVRCAGGETVDAAFAVVAV